MTSTLCPVCMQLFSKGIRFVPSSLVELAGLRCLRCRAIHAIVEDTTELRSDDPLLGVHIELGRMMYVDLYSSDGQMNRCHSFHVFRTREDETVDIFPGIGVGRAVAGNAGDQTTIDFIKDRLLECSRHSKCEKQRDRPLPTRLVRIHQDSSSLSLAETAGQSGRYAALSYCWGDTAQMVKTDHSTLELHKREIPWGKLPKTIQDAIDVTRALGLEYIWVDALCIIQGSQDGNKGDWETEAAKMADYYSNALVTIGASSAASADQGIFTPREEWHAPKRVEISDWDGRSWEGLQQKQLLAQERPTGDLMRLGRGDTGPISARGWTFQENSLASRMIHFTSLGLMWECRQHMTTENGHTLVQEGVTTTSIIRNLQANPPIDDAGDTWANFVLLYTARTLRYHSDRLAAIAGIASWLKQHRPEFRRYQAGLWEDTIANDLSWIVFDSKSSHPAFSEFPSWSWTSVNERVCFLFPPSSSVVGEKLCHMDANAPTKSSSNVPHPRPSEFVSVTQHELYLRAPMQRAYLELAHSAAGSDFERLDFKLSLFADPRVVGAVGATGVQPPTPRFFPDSHLRLTEIVEFDGSRIEAVRRSEISSPFCAEVFLLWCGWGKPGDSNARSYTGVVLSKVANGRYARVGAVSCSIPLDQEGFICGSCESVVLV
ncbi:heterokaryon incompatibility protein-domain-containing protein [Echria macrotheca]|uniref:Heterokaryon incompatibility protein-domain-containing protein n=1 Tax=Echria macrotheca TaxID=438768 RepID=A0AAJ0B8N9_9PEZI|nr:heterokaryon incompatibility protein-domain-containing protein [Echria macrotheca]